MAKREQCTFLLNLFSLAALNSFMHSRGTTLPPDFKVGEGSRKGVWPRLRGASSKDVTVGKTPKVPCKKKSPKNLTINSQRFAL